MRPVRVLVVDDNAQILKQASEAIQRLVHAEAPNGFEVYTEQKIEEGGRRMRTERYDLVILDIQEEATAAAPAQPSAGVNEYDKVLADQRFVPVVFYTAHIDKAPELVGALVEVVDKADGIKKLTDVVGKLLDTRLLKLRSFLEQQQLEIILNAIPEFAAATGVPQKSSEIGASLARSISRALESPQVRELLGLQPDFLHPRECYVIPSSTPHPTTGDLYERSDASLRTHWIVLNPACDLVGVQSRKPKVKQVLLAKCQCVNQHATIIEALSLASKLEQIRKDPKTTVDMAIEASTKAKEMSARAWFLIDNRDPAWHTLAGFGSIPDLIANFRDLSLAPYEDLAGTPWKRIASLDSPFAEAVNNRFTQFFGRIGVPDVDTTGVAAKLGLKQS